jgi:hypothetical protein
LDGTRVDATERIQVLLWFIFVALVVFTVFAVRVAWKAPPTVEAQQTTTPTRASPQRLLRQLRPRRLRARSPLAICQLPQPRPYFGRRQSLQGWRTEERPRPTHARRRVPLLVAGEAGWCLLRKRLLRGSASRQPPRQLRHGRCGQQDEGDSRVPCELAVDVAHGAHKEPSACQSAKYQEPEEEARPEQVHAAPLLL